MINDHEEKKAFSMVSSIIKKKEFANPLSIRGNDAINLAKENPFPIQDENELKLFLQQNKSGQGFNLDYSIIDGGTGGGNSIKINRHLMNMSPKKSGSESNKNKRYGSQNQNIKRYFGNSQKSKKSNKQGYLKKDLKHPNGFRIRTCSVEPTEGAIPHSPSSASKHFQRHYKSVAQNKPHLIRGLRN